MPKYKRILLKLSGESLAGAAKQGIDTEELLCYVRQIKEVVDLGTQVGIVIGGGNIFRGLAGEKKGFDRVKGDYMGMLATTINSLALQSAFESIGQKAVVFTSFSMEVVGKRFNQNDAIAALQEGKVAILAGGTGNPFFTTDTASALRAIELNCDLLLKGTRVDGIYSADPEKYPTATKFDFITFDQVYEKELNIMDLTAFTLCRENELPILVFNMNVEGNLKKATSGEKTGTLVSNKLPLIP